MGSCSSCVCVRLAACWLRYVLMDPWTLGFSDWDAAEGELLAPVMLMLELLGLLDLLALPALLVLVLVVVLLLLAVPCCCSGCACC